MRAVQSSAPIERFLEELRRQAQAFYGERLISLAVFGSYASGRARPGSDLDLLIVLSAAGCRSSDRCKLPASTPTSFARVRRPWSSP
jgi:predicted nucleotidyltransferase